jgi:hypothetical protein
VVVAAVAMGVVAGVAIGTVGDTANAAAQAPVSVIVGSYACATAFVEGIRQLEARAHSGSRAHSEWTRLPYAVVASGGVARTPVVDAPPENSVAWVTAGQPSPATTIDEEWLSFTPRSGGTIGVNRELCSPATRRVALTKVGLSGGLVGSAAVQFACEVPRRVLIRLSAVVNGGTALRKRGRLFRATNAPARNAKLVVATPAGKVLTYAEVSDSGQARLLQPSHVRRTELDGFGGRAVS